MSTALARPEGPDFFARTLDGRGLWLKALRGRPVLLIFAERTEALAPAVDAYAELVARGVEVVAAVSTIEGGEPAPFPVVSDLSRELAGAYGAPGPVSACVLDEAGRVERALAGKGAVNAALAFVLATTPAVSRRASLHGVTARAGAVIQGRFRLDRLIARGGMGEVWRAEHLHLRTPVAIKILASPDGEASDAWIEGAVRRFRFEAQVAACLAARTPHVVAVTDAGYDDVGPYLAMELVEGVALDERILIDGFLTPEELAPLLDQIGAALTVAHAAGIVHRDLKPANVLLARGKHGEPIVKLTDFGIAKARPEVSGFDRPTDTGVAHVVGTPEYMAPEQIRGDREPTPAVDVWAFGVVVFEALTGGLPFQAGSGAELLAAIARQPARRPSELRPTLPSALDAWMEKALAKSPGDRFGSIGEAVAAYHRAIEPDLPAWTGVDADTFTPFARPSAPTIRIGDWTSTPDGDGAAPAARRVRGGAIAALVGGVGACALGAALLAGWNLSPPVDAVAVAAAPAPPPAAPLPRAVAVMPPVAAPAVGTKGRSAHAAPSGSAPAVARTRPAPARRAPRAGEPVAPDRRGPDPSATF